jgi:hypothetical protein
MVLINNLTQNVLKLLAPFSNKDVKIKLTDNNIVGYHEHFKIILTEYIVGIVVDPKDSYSFCSGFKFFLWRFKFKYRFLF